MKLCFDAVTTFLKYFMAHISFLNYGLFLSVKFCLLKVNGCRRDRHFRKNRNCGFLLLEVVIALALSLGILSFFGLTLGRALFELRYQRDRLTALCCTQSGINRCITERLGAGTFTTVNGQFTTQVSCAADARHARFLNFTGVTSWPSGSVTLRSGFVL